MTGESFSFKISIVSYLIAPVLSLKVGVVPGPDGSHGSGLVARVGLSRVLKVRVRPARAVHADVASHVDVRTAVGLAHNSNYGDLVFLKKM